MRIAKTNRPVVAKLPKPVKNLVVAYHENEKGETLKDADGNPLPAIIRSFRVCPMDMTVDFMDAQANVHKITCKKGELDWRNGVVTVKETELDEEGNVLVIHNLSHECQYTLNVARSNFATGALCYNRRKTQRYIPRFNVHATKKATILSFWQAQADSPDATWLDGKPPTKAEYEQAQKEYLARKAEAAKNRALGQQQNQPATVTDGDDDGETFDEFTA